MNASRSPAGLFRENAVAVRLTIHCQLDDDPAAAPRHGNVSQVVPTIQPSFKIGESSLSVHTAEFREAARAEPAQKAMLDCRQDPGHDRHRRMDRTGPFRSTVAGVSGSAPRGVSAGQ